VYLYVANVVRNMKFDVQSSKTVQVRSSKVGGLGVEGVGLGFSNFLFSFFSNDFFGSGGTLWIVVE